MLSDAYITATCDSCGERQELELTATARGWDERNIAGKLKEYDWLVDGDRHICPDCQSNENKS
jgi:hypothetical protein